MSRSESLADLSSIIAEELLTSTRKLSLLNSFELEILRLLASGLDLKQIAHRLNVAEKSVRNQTPSIYRHLGVKNRNQVAIIYIASCLKPVGYRGDGRRMFVVEPYSKPVTHLRYERIQKPIPHSSKS